MTHIGLTLDRSTNFLSGAQLIELVTNIERLGFESVWLLDAFGREPFMTAGFILANTRTLKVGTGVANIYGRDPTTAVQTLETFSELYPGRFTLGLGVSNPAVIAMRKGSWIAPLPKMRAYLAEMADIKFAGIKSEVLAPICIAAHAPGLQSLAQKHGHGIMTWIMSTEIIAQARKHVGVTPDITAQIPCVLTTNVEEARRIARTYLAMYFALPYYQAAFGRAGFDRSECTEGGGSDRLIDAIVAWGTPSDIRSRVAEFGRAGATRVVLNPLCADSAQKGIGDAPVVTSDWENLPHLSEVLRLTG